MAKQSGLHQIRGKVGEHSYYRQSGVASGLIRSINQGLSSRVKTGEEYANTRLNNAEFGAACGIASMLGGMVTPKYRPMILPFSQSKMSKALLELARQNDAPWGQRVVGIDDTQQIADILTSTSKLNIVNFATVDVTRPSAGSVAISVKISGEQATSMVSLGIDGVFVKGACFVLRTGKYNSAEMRIAKSIAIADGSSAEDTTIQVGTSASVNINFSVDSVVPVISSSNVHRLAVVVFMPYRTVGGVDYTLQDKCCFVCVPLPEYEP